MRGWYSIKGFSPQATLEHGGQGSKAPPTACRVFERRTLCDPFRGSETSPADPPRDPPERESAVPVPSAGPQQVHPSTASRIVDQGSEATSSCVFAMCAHHPEGHGPTIRRRLSLKEPPGPRDRSELSRQGRGELLRAVPGGVPSRLSQVPLGEYLEAGRVHPAGPGKLPHLRDVGLAPSASRPTGSVPVGVARFVKRAYLTVDPSEAERLLDGLEVGHGRPLGPLFEVPDPELRRAPVILFEPSSEELTACEEPHLRTHLALQGHNNPTIPRERARLSAEPAEPTDAERDIAIVPRGRHHGHPTDPPEGKARGTRSRRSAKTYEKVMSDRAFAKEP